MACTAESGRRWDERRLLVWALSLVLLSPVLAWAEPSIHLPDVAAATGPESPDETAVRKLLGDYARAIEHKDLGLFRTVKPNLTKEEESRLQKAFSSVQSQVVKITIQSIQVQVRQATVRLMRRDTIDSSMIASFPQTLLLDRVQDGWTIREINR
ncbi:MAG TPA: hypothetical protein VN461_22030 [Vicinamibacteria bacterium]|jgi:hypothetical protein|nr:hypothetical protein [Vicinamibacteria bacterium]